MNREKVPPNIAVPLMVINKHTCCICNEKRKHVQIHHIDENPNNNGIENLAVLCMDCHSWVTGDEGLGREFTMEEVKEYKNIWERKCKNELESGDMEEEDEETDQGNCETITLERDSYEAYEYSLDKDDVIAVWADSEKNLSVFVMGADEFEKYKDDPDYEFEYLDAKENEQQIELEYIVEEDGDYVVMFLNESKRTFDAEIDIQIW